MIILIVAGVLVLGGAAAYLINTINAAVEITLDDGRPMQLVGMSSTYTFGLDEDNIGLTALSFRYPEWAEDDQTAVDPVLTEICQKGLAAGSNKWRWVAVYEQIHVVLLWQKNYGPFQMSTTELFVFSQADGQCELLEVRRLER